MRSTVAIIDVIKLKNNYNILRNLAPNASIMAIVKANAYGHGIVECSTALQNLGVEYFGVAFPSEGIKLREAGITKPILVLVTPNEYELEAYCKHNLDIIANSLDLLTKLDSIANEYGKKINAHLFINTGMNRDGIRPEEAYEFYIEASKLKNIEIIAICTHFTSSEEKDQSFTLLQIERFNRVLENFNSKGISFRYIHAANSAAVINYPQSIYNMIRPGIALYGYNLSETNHLKLEPVLTLKTKVHRVLELNPGESVGYNRRFIAQSKTKICTIPIGYGDGFPYSVNGNTQCIINGKKYPLIGTICMDQSIVNIGDDQVNIGDEVILIGSDGINTISAIELARQNSTIPYDILTSLQERIPRLYVENL